nr:MAG TPA: hypothetical protein [Caudoviricetes sp.]
MAQLYAIYRADKKNENPTAWVGSLVSGESLVRTRTLLTTAETRAQQPR